MIKRILFTALCTLIFISNLQASHLMGGEITWSCLPNGQYRFFMKVYRDCNGATFGTTGINLDVHNVPGVTSIPMNIVSQTDISPACNSFSGPPITCAGATGTTAGAVQEFVFQSNPITLNGVPSAAGWVFSYSNCCRNGAITNLPNASGDGFTLRAVMYPYNGQNANPCYDSSPYFVESPNTIICSGYPFTYNPTAVDPEIDSLYYDWARPLDSWPGGAWNATNPTPLAFSAGYSFTNPLPGPVQNPGNTGATLNNSTGEISYTSFTNGVFVTVNKVSAFKCGILIAEIFRDIQVTLKNCPPMNTAPNVPNSPPTVTKPFQDTTGAYTLTIDTVYAGELVHFDLTATDWDFDASLAISQPSSFGFQLLKMVANGAEFGTGFTNPAAGCAIPPCATLFPWPQVPAPAAAAVTFDWQTSCDHLGFFSGCVNFSNEYTFVIKAVDDFCPAPGINTTTVKIVVLAPPQVNAPVIRCTEVLPNGDVTLTWTAPVDTFNAFNAYMIYHATNQAGPYTLIDSVFNIAQTSYTHVGAGANTAVQYYQIESRDLCKAFRYSTPNSAATIFVNAFNNGSSQSQINWNAITTPLLTSSTGLYYIYREYPTGNWSLIDSTNALSYLDNININACNDSINYRIEIRDSIGCTSVSSIDGAWFQNPTQPDPPIIRCIVADNSGAVTLNWIAPLDTGLSFDGYFIYSATNPAGPFAVVDSVFNYNQTNYTHLTANVVGNPRYYYLRTFCTCGLLFSINSDTLQAMRLNVTNPLGGQIANLSWNALHVPKLPSSAATYNVYREYPAGNWVLRGTTPNLNYLDTNAVCIDSVNYRIELSDASGCISKSTINGATFIDNTVPDAPELRCVNVNANGTTTLTWTLPVDTGLDFNSYHIYSANNIGGPYTIIDSSFNYATGSYNHVTANAYAGNLFYTIKTRTGCGVRYSVNSDTLQAMRLNVTNPLGGQVANLSWNAMRNPKLPTSAVAYNVYREYPAGVWNLRGTTPNLTYLDTNAVCIDSINYRIEIGDALGCVSTSTIDGATFIDNTVPDAPELRCVTVNANGTTTLTWTLPVDTGLDFNSYHIYSANNIGGPYTEIDSLFNYATGSYNHATANAYAANLFYTIKTRTGCGVRYSVNSDTLQAMRLNVTNPLGGQVANLSWNAMRNPKLPTSAAAYNVYREYPAGVWNLRGTTPNLTYLDTNAVCIDSINYRIEIGDALGCVSTSTIDGETFIDNHVPDAPELRCVTVNANGTTTLTWTLPVDTGLDFNSYHIYSANNIGGPYTEIDSLFNYATGSYNHVTANAYAGNLFYTIKTRTGCGVTYSLGSDTLQAMRLNVTNPLGGQVANLSWNAMRNPKLPTSAAAYNVYREYPAGVWNLRGTTPNLTYLDTNAVCIDSINYRIEIGDALGCVSTSTIDGETFVDNTVPDAPELRCVTVNANGTTTLTWTLPVDTGLDFNSYQIYSANTIGGPYTEIDSLFNYATGSYNHATANAYAANLFYTIKTRTGCGVVYSLGSDTLQAIRLDVTNPLGGQVANLSWNALHTPNLPTSAAAYNVYREYPAGVWNLRGTTPNLNYVDTNPVCIDSINYRIEIGDALGCVSTSTIDGETFIDNTVPDAPELRCVTVNANGTTTLTWTLPVDTGLDFNSYHIYSANTIGGPYTEIDSLFNYATGSYNHATANAYAANLFYTIKTRTGCGVTYSLGSDTLQAMRLNVTNPLGGQVANLSWNALHTPNLPSSAAAYNVYREYPSGVWNLRGTTPNLNYVDTNPVCIDLVNYRIELTDAFGCISVSTVDGETFVDNTVPDAPELRCVTVNANGTTTLTWTLPVDTGLDFNSYHIYSANTIGGPYTEIDSLFNYSTGSYNHATANAYTTDLFYTIKTRTGCGVIYSLGSDTLQAIRLDVTNPLGGQVANLSWNALHNPNLPTSAAAYNVYREYPAGVWNLRGTTPNLNYVDTNPVCIDLVNYRIELTDAFGCISVSTVDGETFVDNTVPDAPELRCVTVNANGTTTLTWTLPVDTGLDFNSYHIYSANTIGGPYTEIDSLFNYATGSYNHATANAYTTDLFYTIKTRTGCGVIYSLGSDTLQAIRLDVTNPLGGQVANLSWNALHVPNLPTSAAAYNVYREYPAGVWNLRGTTPNLYYVDTNPVCIDLVNYRIELTDAFGCISASTVDGETFVDNTIPAAPGLSCVSINTNGTATLSWSLPVDTGLSFSSYHIFYSTSPNGPFNIIDSIFDYNTSLYTHATANGNTSNVYYYVESRTNCGVQYSAPSDTLHGIKLNVTSIGGGVANLQWNELHTPLLPTSDAYYKVYREYPTGTWAYLDSTSALNFQDTINLCSAFINYRIEIADASGCVSISSIDGDLFSDITPPAITLFDTISVNPATGNVTISWLKNSSTDVVGYIVYLFNGASWDSIGNSTSINNLSYLYTNSNANNVVETFNIAAYDSCGNIAPLGTRENTILVRDSLDKCNAAIVLFWNSYNNMVGGLASYNIIKSINGGPFKFLANVPANMLTYADKLIKKDTTYCYYIQAVGNVSTRTASSNESCIMADVIILPQFSYLKRATVTSANEVLVEALIDTAADLMKHQLLRSDDGGTSYNFVTEIPFTGTPEISFIDKDVMTGTTSHKYKVVDISTCNKPVLESNIGRTILLRTTPFENLVNKLEWNAYSVWDGGVLNYDIYRYYNGVWTASPIATVPANTLTYMDNVSAFIDGTGEFCYLVTAHEAPGNIYGYQMKSESNESCAVQQPHIYLPNAFTPGGANPIFHPYMIYVLEAGYQMQVFNRWGQVVFETGNTQEGWDGTFNGAPAQQGVYAYSIKVKAANGTLIEKRGTVTLLR